MFFLCKQKTAYEMRISEWSADVCSSDLERFQHGLMCGNEESLESLERKYSIALSLLDATYLAKSSQIKADIYKAADLMLMAAFQGVPMAIKYDSKSVV